MAHVAPIWMLLLAVLALGCAASSSASGVPEDGGSVGRPFVSLAEFEALRAEGARVLDARDAESYAGGHVPGAVHAPWQRFVRGAQSGLLLDDLDELTRRVGALGVGSVRPVLVYGAWDRGWGEEGRIQWMLEYLGRDEVLILRGGYERWLSLGKPPSRTAAEPLASTFVPTPRPELRASATDVQAALTRGNVVLIDSRDRAEYDGATPYGSPRGGHIPSAVSLSWKDLIAPRTHDLRPPAELRARFRELGIGEDTLVIAYCTGGVRSAFTVAVLRSLGLGAPRNYDGSFWEWSEDASLPLEH